MAFYLEEPSLKRVRYYYPWQEERKKERKKEKERKKGKTLLWYICSIMFSLQGIIEL